VAAAGVPVGVVAGLAVVMLVPAATCFAKVLVVGYILRAGLSGGGWAGAGTVLPAAVLHSAAAVLTLLVMRPVAAETWAAAAADRDRWAAVDWADRNAVGELSARLAEPLRRFLFRNTREADRAHLAGLSARMAERRAEGRPEAEAAAEAVAAPGEESLEVLLPAFLASELRRAFRIGVLVCLPFLIVDLLAAAALAALGAPMMPPTAVSLPLKLLLFTAADGWPMLMRGLLLAYR
jgi:flagellar biosynthesis protein FliP